MNKILILAILIGTSITSSFSQAKKIDLSIFTSDRIGFLYSMNFPLNPSGMAMSYSNEKFTLLANWNTGTSGGLLATQSNSGVYALSYPGNRVVGETSSYSMDRNILTFSGGPVIYRNGSFRISALAGIGKNMVRTIDQTYHKVHDDMNVLDDYLLIKSTSVEKLSPTIFTFNVVLEKGLFILGAGINTPPAGSGAPIRTNLMIGLNIPMMVSK